MEASAQLVSVDATLGPGFSLLIVYCIVAGLLHYFYHSAAAEYYQSGPHYKVDKWWTKVLGPLLTNRRPDLVGKNFTEETISPYDDAEETQC